MPVLHIHAFADKHAEGSHQLRSYVWWWVKGDSVDVVKGIGESVRGIWSGDVYLNDVLFQEYQKVCAKAAQIGLGHRAAIHEDIAVAMGNLKDYLIFLSQSKLFAIVYSAIFMI